MLGFAGVVEVDGNQVRPRVVAARIDDDGAPDFVEERSSEFRALVDVTVQRQAGLVMLNPIPHGPAADMAAIEKHVALGVKGWSVNDRYGVRGVLDGKSIKFLLDARAGIEVSAEVLDRCEAARRPVDTAVRIGMGIWLGRVVPPFEIFQLEGRGGYKSKTGQSVSAQISSLPVQILDETFPLEFFERRENGLAVVIARDGEDAQRCRSLLPIVQELRYVVKQELLLLDGHARGSPGRRARTKVPAEDQSVRPAAYCRFPGGAVEIKVAM